MDSRPLLLTSTFSELLQVVYSTTNLLQFDPTPQQAAEARYLRAYVMLSVLDGWGQVPFREAGSSLLEDAQVLGPQEVVDFVVSEMDAIINDLPAAPAKPCQQRCCTCFENEGPA